MNAQPAADDLRRIEIVLPVPIWLGGKRRVLVGRLQVAAVLLLLAAIASMPMMIGAGTWLQHRALRREWTIAGPACPVVAQISPAAMGAKPPAPFTYRGTHFAYQIGDVECAAVPEKSVFDSSHYTACQFDAAGAVEVTEGGRSTIFEPGVGHGAMVTVRRGQVTCEVAASGEFHGSAIGQRLQRARAAEAARAEP